MSAISTISATGDIFSALQSAYSAPAQAAVPHGSKFANVDPTLWQGTWTATDSNGKPVTLKILNVSGYRATVRFQSADAGLQFGRVLINTNNVFRIGSSQMQLTKVGRMTISTVITDPATGNQSIETNHATLQGS
jgi:hypothetical protein